jgi:glycosyltransferase involved in cell wall biosynthesis
MKQKSKKADIVLSKVVPIYNKEKYLPLALRSVQNQSLRDIEIVCLNDGSTDNSVEVIEKFQKDEPRIVLYKHEYEKAEITGADIIHFKNLLDEPNGILIQNGRSPKISGIMKQPQLSDAIFNKKKNLAVNTVAM